MMAKKKEHISMIESVIEGGDPNKIERIKMLVSIDFFALTEKEKERILNLCDPQPKTEKPSKRKKSNEEETI
jgi:hypothetical protein